METHPSRASPATHSPALCTGTRARPGSHRLKPLLTRGSRSRAHPRHGCPGEALLSRRSDVGSRDLWGAGGCTVGIARGSQLRRTDERLCGRCLRLRADRCLRRSGSWFGCGLRRARFAAPAAPKLADFSGPDRSLVVWGVPGSRVSRRRRRVKHRGGSGARRGQRAVLPRPSSRRCSCSPMPRGRSRTGNRLADCPPRWPVRLLLPSSWQQRRSRRSRSASPSVSSSARSSCGSWRSGRGSTFSARAGTWDKPRRALDAYTDLVTPNSHVLTQNVTVSWGLGAGCA
jgi:hypothetical protein